MEIRLRNAPAQKIPWYTMAKNTMVIWGGRFYPGILWYIVPLPPQNTMVFLWYSLPWYTMVFYLVWYCGTTSTMVFWGGTFYNGTLHHGETMVHCAMVTGTTQNTTVH